MQWEKVFTHNMVFEEVSSNQHGIRYKQSGSKCLSVAKLSAKCTDAIDMRMLILLSHHLDTPVRYDFESEPQEAFIEVVSQEQLKK